MRCGPESQGSVGPPLLLAPSPHSAMCHFSGLLTLLECSFFVIGCWQITGLPLLLPGV
ncbi:unnamed protein product [Staurois parvus]|uniref:Uncharacterized protein n=1 Tax=Staurois parvus TaxID=386267 RepID=A0ABN9CHG7_9NEOB|nr:unnamed protein product [Staurois parvus]